MQSNNYVNTARPSAPYASGVPPQQQPLANGMMPTGQQYGSQQNYGAYPQKQFGQTPQQPYNNSQPYNTAPTYGQPPMAQPQFGAPPAAPQAAAFGSQQYPPQQNYSTGFQQAGGPGPMNQMGGMGAPMGGQMGMGAPMMGGPMGGQMGMGGMGGTVSLVKGGNMSLTKAVPNLHQVRVGLGWDVRQTPGAPFDLDASVFLLKGDGRVRMAQDLIFYNNKQAVDGSVFHHGDNLTGVGEGDDEMVTVNLMRVPPEIQRIVCVVSIYEAEQRMQNFGMVNRAFIRVVNSENNQEVVRFDLTEEASMFNCMVFGELYRYNGEWKFKAIGQGVPGGLKACGPMFGLSMA